MGEAVPGDHMTQAELDALAHQAQADPAAMGNFTYLLGYLYLAGLLRPVEAAPDFRPTRTHSDSRTDAFAPH